MNRRLLLMAISIMAVVLVVVVGVSIKKYIDIVKEERKNEIEIMLEESRERWESDQMSRVAEEGRPKLKNYQVIETILKKNQDWSNIRGYFTDEFLSKYNEKDGFLKDAEVEDVKRDITYIPQEIDYWDTNHPVYIVTISGKRYRYYLKWFTEEIEKNGITDDKISDIQVLDIVDLDSDDESIIHGAKFTENDTARLLRNMLFEYNGEAGLTKHFRNKYNYKEGLFDRGGIPLEHERFDGLVVKKFRLVTGYGDCYLDYDNRVLKEVTILDVYRELVNHYDIHFVLDKDGYLDDYNMILVKQVDMKMRKHYIKDHPTYSEVASRLCYTNRNWDGLPITQSFRNKYSSKDGILKGVDVDYIEYLCKTDDMPKYPICVHLLNGGIKYYGLNFKLVNNDSLIDDIEVTELNIDSYDDYTLDEILEMF